MKKPYIILVALCVVTILCIASYFPYGVIYKITLEEMQYWSRVQARKSIDINAVRWRLTLFTIAGSVIIAGIMFLLQKACRKLELEFLKRLLTGGIFYIVVMSFLMTTGMWLDFHLARELPIREPRIGFIFVPASIPMEFY